MHASVNRTQLMTKHRSPYPNETTIRLYALYVYLYVSFIRSRAYVYAVTCTRDTITLRLVIRDKLSRTCLVVNEQWIPLIEALACSCTDNASTRSPRVPWASSTRNLVKNNVFRGTEELRASSPAPTAVPPPGASPPDRAGPCGDTRPWHDARNGNPSETLLDSHGITEYVCT